MNTVNYVESLKSYVESLGGCPQSSAPPQTPPQPAPTEPPPPLPSFAASLASVVPLKKRSTEELRRTLSAGKSMHTAAFIDCVRRELERRGVPQPTVTKPDAKKEVRPKLAAPVAPKPITKTPAPKAAPERKEPTMKKPTKTSTMTRDEAMATLRELADDPKAPALERKLAGEVLSGAGERLPPKQHAKVLASMGIREPSDGRPIVHPGGAVEFKRMLPSEARARHAREMGGAA